MAAAARRSQSRRSRNLSKPRIKETCLATISGNGGAERYWRHADGRRLVLCRNGEMLVQVARGGRWHAIASKPPISALSYEKWELDAGQAARAAVTRTGRQARRGEGG